ncbi:phenylalanyl-tRNA synthetase, alpha subunit [Thermosyntropha lipolytica DSM 11003]|uniref:Phenylalanine--tRNA ligase alpha subunit n=1 Tax=Thermosyntropha lipolytica DSM 11003 TaxID=1123382 RepID=A0A1M5K4X8_9FIRM|nr:phenylalanine--tRNA ligase subunit alpha [Thermosyntropha lipolytica]SHG47836.1 phenylalanyl-tRNA synthetase, alpha subunit [Thermosyntropha lipolytica DSM 11003]
MINELKEIKMRAEERLKEITSLDELNELKVKILGRKGEITLLLKKLKDIPPAERAEVGKMANEIKSALESRLEEKEKELRQKELELRLSREAVDITLPGLPLIKGRKHPLTQVMDEIRTIFTGMGFTVAEGPEVEKDYYNFEALNIPKDHPARDMQDSFYITEEILLRTHTSPVQVRTMEKMAPQIPVKIIVPGRVYRRDDDATHSPMFHQIEGLVIDERITFAHLKGTLMLFAKKVFGEGVRVRYRPSFFPFTEPSAEMDISCVICGGEGCRVCSYTGWLEILGAGMVHPRVLEYGGYDPEKVTGFAFGMGVERIAMLKYGINDLRLFFENDKRFLTQF